MLIHAMSSVPREPRANHFSLTLEHAVCILLKYGISQISLLGFAGPGLVFELSKAMWCSLISLPIFRGAFFTSKGPQCSAWVCRQHVRATSKNRPSKQNSIFSKRTANISSLKRNMEIIKRWKDGNLWWAEGWLMRSQRAGVSPFCLFGKTHFLSGTQENLKFFSTSKIY